MATKDEQKVEQAEAPRTETVHHTQVTRPSGSRGPLIGVAIAIGLIVLLIGAGSGFLAGIAVGGHLNTRNALRNSALNEGPGAPRYQTQGGYQNNRGVSRTFAMTTGTVSDVSSTSITIKTTRGTTVTYTITSATTVTNGGNSASVSDIKTGDTVSVRQTNDTTGDAASIQINP